MTLPTRTVMERAYEALTADDLSPLVTQEAVENARIILAEALIACPNVECEDGIDMHVNAPCQDCARRKAASS